MNGVGTARLEGPAAELSVAAELPGISLSDLVQELARWGIAAVASDPSAAVHGASIDSRAVDAGCLFVCKGAGFRPQFLSGALGAGAAAYMCEAVVEPGGEPLRPPQELLDAAPGAPYLAVRGIRKAMARVSPLIFGHPERKLTIIGITGTKGKSTTAYMLRSILRAAGQEPSILGSIETDDGAERFESHNTTPEAPDLWRHLFHTVQAGRTCMVMEVSSQGLKYDRVLGLPLDIACFLNIGRDHISPIEHPTFEDYFASKLRIFDHAQTAVVNLATKELERVMAAAAHARRCVTTLAEMPGHEDGLAKDRTAHLPANLGADHIAASAGGVDFEVAEGSERHRIRLGIPGLFNVENALVAIACARQLGIGYDAIAAGLAHVRVPGRMEPVVSPDGKILALVDYAHNELSYETLFHSVKAEYPKRKVVAVFGAPGDKALERREVLPRVAARYADLLIYTEEDPAHESVEQICAELAAHTPDSVEHRIVCDRTEAIRQAFAWAQQAGEAVVLLLGKGDETRQHRGDAYPEVTSDLELARDILGVAER